MFNLVFISYFTVIYCRVLNLKLLNLCTNLHGALLYLGREVEVNQMNIYQYVRRYAEHRMVVAQEKALKNLRDGTIHSLSYTVPI